MNTSAIRTEEPEGLDDFVAKIRKESEPEGLDDFVASIRAERDPLLGKLAAQNPAVNRLKLEEVAQRPEFRASAQGVLSAQADADEKQADLERQDPTLFQGVKNALNLSELADKIRVGIWDTTHRAAEGITKEEEYFPGKTLAESVAHPDKPNALQEAATEPGASTVKKVASGAAGNYAANLAKLIDAAGNDWEGVNALRKTEADVIGKENLGLAGSSLQNVAQFVPDTMLGKLGLYVKMATDSAVEGAARAHEEGRPEEALKEGVTSAALTLGGLKLGGMAGNAVAKKILGKIMPGLSEAETEKATEILKDVLAQGAKNTAHGFGAMEGSAIAGEGAEVLRGRETPGQAIENLAKRLPQTALEALLFAAPGVVRGERYSVGNPNDPDGLDRFARNTQELAIARLVRQQEAAQETTRGAEPATGPVMATARRDLMNPEAPARDRIPQSTERVDLLAKDQFADAGNLTGTREATEQDQMRAILTAANDVAGKPVDMTVQDEANPGEKPQVPSMAEGAKLEAWYQPNAEGRAGAGFDLPLLQEGAKQTGVKGVVYALAKWFHEVGGHHGTRSALKKPGEYDRMLDDVFRNVGLAKIAERIGAGYRTEGVEAGTPESRRLAEEYLASTSELAATPDGRNTLRNRDLSALQRARYYGKSVLRSVGVKGKWLDSMAEKEVDYLVNNIVRGNLKSVVNRENVEAWRAGMVAGSLRNGYDGENFDPSIETEKGKRAIDNALSEKKDQIDVMFRPELGPISFIYGRPGKIDGKGRYANGEGLLHLIAQRNNEGEDGEQIVRLMPEVIAFGEIGTPLHEGTIGERVSVSYKGHTAILSLYRFGNKGTWLLTGWKNEVGAVGVNPNRAYVPGNLGLSSQEGASSAIVPQADGAVKPEETPPEVLGSARMDNRKGGIPFSRDAEIILGALKEMLGDKAGRVEALARTLAEGDGSPEITDGHVKEALRLRNSGSEFSTNPDQVERVNAAVEKADRAQQEPEQVPETKPEPNQMPESPQVSGLPTVKPEQATLETPEKQYTPEQTQAPKDWWEGVQQKTNEGLAALRGWWDDEGEAVAKDMWARRPEWLGGKGSRPITNEKQDLATAARFEQPSWATERVPQLRKMWKKVRDYVYRRIDEVNALVCDESGANEIKPLMELAKKAINEYKLLNAYLWDRDRAGVGYRVEQQQTGFEVLEPKTINGKLEWVTRSTHATEDEAWQSAYAYEGDDAINKYGMTARQADALVKLRRVLHRDFLSMRGQVKEAIDSAKKNGEDEPTVPYNGKEISLWEALKLIGDRRGYYMPRVRTPGKFAVRAFDKNGQEVHFELTDRESKANNIAALLEKKGYRAEIKYSDTLPQNIYQAADVTALDAVLKKAVEGMKNTKSGDMATTWKALGIAASNIIYTRADGSTERHFFLASDFNERMNRILKAFGGNYYEKQIGSHVSGWHFTNVREGFERELFEYVSHVMGESKDDAANIGQALAQQLATVLEARGSRSRKIGRVADSGNISGYIEDAARAVSMAVNGNAGGTAKSKLFKECVRIITGKELSWEDYQKQNGIDADTPPEVYREAWRRYAKQVRESAIDPALQPKAYREAISLLDDQMRNPEYAERVVSFWRGVASVKYLSGPMSAVADLTSMITVIPATLSHFAGIKTEVALKRVIRGSSDYVKASRWYDGGKGESGPSADHKWLIEQLKHYGYDGSQLNREATEMMKTRMGKIGTGVVDTLMFLKSRSEMMTRGAAIFSAFDVLKNSMTKEDALEQALDISDKANGVYGKANKPAIARGDTAGAQVASSYLMFKTWTMNYIGLLHRVGIKDRDIKNALWMTLAPAIFGGPSAIVGFDFLHDWVLAPLWHWLMGGERDPKEEFFRFLKRTSGQKTEEIARYGLPAAVGFNMSGSLKFGVESPIKLDRNGNIVVSASDALGPLGGAIQDAANFGAAAWHGDAMRAAETIAPRFGSSPVRAFREATQGVTKTGGKPVMYEGKPLQPSGWDTIVRAVGGNPSGISAKRDEVYADTSEAGRYQERRAEIYDMVRQFVTNGRKSADKKEFIAAAKEYNKMVDSNKPKGVKRIEADDLRAVATRTIKDR